jgi:hypothetical protein
MRKFIFSLILLLMVPTVSPAQVNPNLAVALAASSAQVGDISPFGVQVQQVIMVQTGGTGRYPQLTQLGLIRGVQAYGVQPLPYGFVVQARVFHDFGFSDWTVGYSNMTGKIEQASFNFAPYNWGGAVPSPQPTAPPAGPVPGPSPTTPSLPSSSGDGCAKYPTLC